jgi:DNA-binding MarR family transcriptional regulator
MSHKELELLVVTFNNTRDIVTDVYERYLVYEAYNRYIKNQPFYNMKWVESTLKLSFPKVQNICNNLVTNGYLVKERSNEDKRVIDLKPTEKLFRGIETFESMKLNELFKQNIKIQEVDGLPCLSDLTPKTKDKIKHTILKLSKD